MLSLHQHNSPVHPRDLEALCINSPVHPRDLEAKGCQPATVLRYLCIEMSLPNLAICFGWGQNV